MEDLVKRRVREYYWEKDFNCAVATFCRNIQIITARLDAGRAKERTR